MDTEENDNSGLDFINQLGIGEPKSEGTEPTTEDNQTTEDVNAQDDLSDSSEQTLEQETENTQSKDTEPDNEMDEIRKQMEVMQKRLDDKDDYINELREQSKQKQEEPQEVEEVVEDFWDDPEAQFKKLKEEMSGQIQMQQLQLQEVHYANTVDDYWKVVNQDALKEAVATDAEFNKKFNESKEPYKVAYEHLTEKNKSKKQSEDSLREKIRKELMEELNVKPSSEKKSPPPNINKMGGSNGSQKKNVSEDGFASFFGKK